jgi:hypothetical protein
MVTACLMMLFGRFAHRVGKISIQSKVMKTAFSIVTKMDAPMAYSGRTVVWSITEIKQEGPTHPLMCPMAK